MKLRSLLIGFVLINSTAIAATQNNILPKVLAGKQSIEIGDFIYLAMPDKGQAPGWGWDWQANNSDIVWKKVVSKVDDSDKKITYINRTGYVRLNVMGDIAVDGITDKETGWEIYASSLEDVKLGPKQMNISPFIDCSGNKNINCMLDLPPSLKKKNISAATICYQGLDPTEYTETYILSAPGKQDITAQLTEEGGATNAHDALYLSPNTSAGCVEDDTYNDTYGQTDNRSPAEILEEESRLTKYFTYVLTSSIPKDDKVCHIIARANEGRLTYIDASQKGNDVQLCSQALEVLKKTPIPDDSAQLPVDLELDIGS